MLRKLMPERASPMPGLPPHEVLDRAMKARLLELRKRLIDVAREVPISDAGLRQIRRGEYRPVPLTARGIDEALQWPPGTVDRIYDEGFDPLSDPALVALPPADSAPGAAAESEGLDEVRRLLDDAEETMRRIQERLGRPQRDRAQVLWELLRKEVEDSTSETESQ
ncbi:hypothetical protein [Thermomonospora cellulosilytica]|uniref:Uncharacterized protein n=1 Tax=Thermomonospora cellulosilytica TaxID=1411118 RepID=A0A7W3MXL2_9ACTN|nr:hypothetical protein [Thermomonospora cellulosilytica]MBA9003777.1 hypothetical protein [Thermomonospora cellulosilytica]